jgi:hypothetical protein
MEKGSKYSLVEILKNLGLQVTDLSQILNVPRQDIFAWIRGEGPLMGIGTLARLNVIYSLALKDNVIECNISQRLVRKEVDGSSLVDLLKEEVIRVDEVSVFIDRLVDMTKELRYKSAKASSERAGFEPLSETREPLISLITCRKFNKQKSLL